MTKQLKLSALFVALLASGTAVAGEASVQGYTVSTSRTKSYATTMENAGKTPTLIKQAKVA